MIKMFNVILQKKERKVKSHLPSPFPCFRLVLKKDAWETAKKNKGWKTYQDGADAMGLTRQAIQMADKARVQVGPDFITRWACCMGNIHGNWWIHFEPIAWGVEDQNHPMYNQAKYKGEMQYSSLSTAAEHRKKDYTAEKQDY